MQGTADPAILPVSDRITGSTCTLAYCVSSSRQQDAGDQSVCSLKCSVLGRHLVVAGSVAGLTARHVTLSAQQQQRERGPTDGICGDWAQTRQDTRPLWVKVKDELARSLLADAAGQGLCAPPTSLLALDAEALDTILQQLPVRRECGQPHLLTVAQLKCQLARMHHQPLLTSSQHAMIYCQQSTCQASGSCRRETWAPSARPAASFAARPVPTGCGGALWSATSRGALATSAVVAGRPSTGPVTAIGRRRASSGSRSVAIRGCGRCRGSAAATPSCQHPGLLALSVCGSSRIAVPPAIHASQLRVVDLAVRP